MLRAYFIYHTSYWPLRAFVLEQEAVLANNIVHWRYRCLEKCLRLPTLLQDVDESLRPLLQRDERQEIMAIHRKPYQHVSPSDPSLVCTCLTCILRWNSLCLVVDFGHWQSHLDRGEPIPMIPRGTHPEWNQRLIAANAAIVSRALRQPIWYACILQMHLWSTVTAIRRHSENKGNKRWRFLMTKADEDTETDAFLEREGPPTLDFPFHRDNYYMLEAFLPNRGWNNEQQRWMYLPAEQHDKDLQYIRTWARARYPAAMNVTDDVL
ncbi:F-box domain-containing protein [Pleurostoma richardsiae]|uniref:F-box domain-containing protein n=1 Tax=Pleurostoma richardsiae TaxID=41990 RepID=A0AA38RS69_9PEZI|nr:F-box domain-containing protein [Pleurostoma richardsiae]